MITWIIISICIEQVVQKDKSTQIPLFQDNRMAKNVFVCLILAFSVYLCIASIIAIPEFQALENDTVDKQEIQVFKNMLDDSTLNKRFDGPIVNVNLPSQSSLRYPSSLHRLNVVINALNLFKDRVESIKNDLNLKQQQIIVNYQTALDEKTALKQRSIYKSNLTNWFLEQQKIITVLSSEKDAINQYVPDRLSMINAIEKDTAKYGKDKTRIEVAYHESDVNYQELIQILNDNNNTLNEYMVNQQDMPERPNIGEEYGIFESMSGWLLKTESMSLALIVGLFGFGLLGAIGSSFIRQKITTDRPDQIEDYVPNLPVVLISGLSSAIVVFLAVKGAIVVFATKDANLNPYILFSTCLVAAVYSEDIWAWARKRLLATFNNKDGEGSGTGKQSDTSGTTS